MDRVRIGVPTHLHATMVLAAVVGIAGWVPSSAMAQQERAHSPQWRGDIARFHEHDWGLWRGGRWSHERHDGRVGWWWVVGSSWYFYPWPVYPYPSPWDPPPIEIVERPTPAAPPPTPYWYLCEASKTYYPYAATCPGGWKQVPAVPADSAASQPR